MVPPNRPTRATQATVIVVTYNSANWIQACLTAIYRQHYAPGFDVVVVDSGSTDKTADIVARRFPKARLIRSENRGFGAANNLGVASTKAKLVAFANPDTMAQAGWLEALLEPLSTKKTITTSQILLYEPPHQINTVGLDLHFLGFSFVRGYKADSFNAEPHEVPGFSGAAFAMRRADYRALEGFDETIFLYGEDAELSWRARNAGFQIIAVPGSKIFHHYTLRLDPPKLYQLERSRQWMLRKHLTQWQRILYAPSRLVARILVNGFGRRFGSAGKEAVRRARSEARALPLPKRATGMALRRFARKTVPFRTAFPGIRAGRCFRFLPNLAFLIDGPWFTRRRRWLDVPR